MDKHEVTAVDEASTLGLDYRPRYSSFATGVGKLVTDILTKYYQETGLCVERLASSYTVRRISGGDLTEAANGLRDLAAADLATNDLSLITGVVSTGDKYVWTFADSDKTAQVEDFDCPADVSDSLDGTWFQLSDEDGTVGVWIDTDDSGTTIPGGASALDRAIEVTGVVTDDTATAVATAVASAINGDSKFSATSSTATVTVTHATAGAVGDAADGDTGITSLIVTTDGSDADTWAYGSAVNLAAITNLLLDGDLTSDLATASIANTAVATNDWMFFDIDDGKIYYGTGSSAFTNKIAAAVPDAEVTLTPAPSTAWVA